MKIPIETSKNITIELEEIFFELEDIVVTSTRTNKIHKNVPIATEVISEKDINDSETNNTFRYGFSFDVRGLRTKVLAESPNSMPSDQYSNVSIPIDPVAA